MAKQFRDKNQQELFQSGLGEKETREKTNGQVSHDDMCVWTKNRTHEFICSIFNWQADWPEDYLLSVIERANTQIETTKTNAAKKKTAYSNASDTLSAFEALIANAPDCDGEDQNCHSVVTYPLIAGLDSMGDPPPVKIEINVTLEYEVSNESRRSNDESRWIDLHVSASRNGLTIESQTSEASGETHFVWKSYPKDRKTVCFEIKPKVSMGELLRQLKRYRRLIPNALFIVVSNDIKYRKEILDEGFGFISFPDAIIFQPKSVI